MIPDIALANVNRDRRVFSMRHGIDHVHIYDLSPLALRLALTLPTLSCGTLREREASYTPTPQAQ